MPEGPGEAPGPSDYANALTSRELKKAVIWIGVGVGVVLLWWLAEPLLLIIGGAVFAAMLDGGVRLLGRVLPIRRGLRLAIVAVAVLLALVGFVALAGTQLAGQAQALQTVIGLQITRGLDYAHRLGIVPANEGVGQIGQQLMGSLGKVTAALGSALGAFSSMAMIVVIGLFVAMEPRLYERGIAWMLPMERRGDFYRTSEKMGQTLRRLMAGRLLGMAVEGVFVAIALNIVGVPMGTLLGILTGLLAFLPNIGAIVSGALIVLVGFSAGTDVGIWAVVVYVAVADVRRLCDRADGGAALGRSGAGAGAGVPAAVRGAVRDHRAGACRSDRGDDQGDAGGEERAGGGGSRGELIPARVTGPAPFRPCRGACPKIRAS